MKPINICNVVGVSLAANTASEVLSLGRYDVYAKDLAFMRVASSTKMDGLTATNGYPIPAGAVIPLIITVPNMHIKATAGLVIHKVGE